MGVPRGQTGNETVVVLKCPPSFHKTEAIPRLACDVRHTEGCIRQLVTTRSVGGPRGSAKVLPQSKPAPKKATVTVRRSAAGLIRYNFLNFSETIASEKHVQQINRMR